jgi:hypothetical protein
MHIVMSSVRSLFDETYGRMRSHTFSAQATISLGN